MIVTTPETPAKAGSAIDTSNILPKLGIVMQIFYFFSKIFLRHETP
jgi:hypothetical protein